MEQNGNDIGAQEALLRGRVEDLLTKDESIAMVVIQKKLMVNIAPSAAVPPPVDSSDPVVRLSKLKSLLDAGLISDDEFQKKKASILEDL